MNTVARKDLKKDNSRLHAILSKFKLSLEDEQKVMVWERGEGRQSQPRLRRAG